MKPAIKNLLLIALVIGLAFAPLFLRHGAEFGGTDDQAKNAVSQLDPGYQAWFKPIWQPQSSEVASFLFALQAAIGSGFVFYYIGYIRGKSAAQKKEDKGD